MTKHWDERFGREEYVYGVTPNLFIQEQAHRLTESSTVAAFAEGEGRNAVYLASQGHHVTAYDYSVNGLQKTTQLAERENVRIETIQKDLVADTIPQETFDAAIMVFGHFMKEDQQLVLEKVISSVKPGGIIMFEVYSEKQLEYQTGGPKMKDMLYDPHDILTWTKDYKVLHFFYGEQHREEGLFHTGLGHVIQGVITK
ncbi:class I SAM-dependent methyltransferase [Alteribacillus iranensis]|uniref:Methyltransferase domain-containing protein n=1 Tax=Alteribacillus iranensis TaxID=930128 RepID=A0A1I2DU13_9BACI|nr:class I SAM-dependent methyltransferase [Alteribacillus iranensis]SFE83753.1 Methyltransferase domain-containing protein [Alteribacillus iranensis]